MAGPGRAGSVASELRCHVTWLCGAGILLQLTRVWHWGWGGDAQSSGCQHCHRDQAITGAALSVPGGGHVPGPLGCMLVPCQKAVPPQITALLSCPSL